jgi:hypothetical protein
MVPSEGLGRLSKGPRDGPGGHVMAQNLVFIERKRWFSRRRQKFENRNSKTFKNVEAACSEKVGSTDAHQGRNFLSPSLAKDLVLLSEFDRISKIKIFTKNVFFHQHFSHIDPTGTIHDPPWGPLRPN